MLDNYELPKAAFEELYLGFETDLLAQGFETMEQLMLCCRRVAGVVGWLIMPISGYRGGQETILNALALGQAMQLTNILRDVGEDLALGRCYLPRELVSRYQIDLADLHSGKITPNYIELIKELAHIAHSLYRLGWQGIPNLQGAAQFSVRVAALNYEGILHKLVQNRYDNLSQRAYLRRLERLALFPRALRSTRAGRRTKSILAVSGRTLNLFD